MKKILFMILLFTAIGFSQANIPVVTGSVDFYADSISQTITLDKSLFLGGIYMPKSRTDTLWFQVYNSTDETWYTLMEDGSEYIVVADSTINNYIPLEPKILYSVKQLKILFNADIADTLTLYFDKRPY